MFRKFFSKLFKGSFSGNVGDFLVSLGERLKKRGERRTEVIDAQDDSDLQQVDSTEVDTSDDFGFDLQPVEEDASTLDEVEFFIDRFTSLVEEAMRKEVWITVGGVRQRTQKSILGLNIISMLDTIKNTSPKLAGILINKLIKAGILNTPIDMLAVELDQYESQKNADEVSDVLVRMADIIKSVLSSNSSLIESGMKKYVDFFNISGNADYIDARLYFGDDPNVVYAGDEYWGVSRAEKPKDNTVTVDSSEWYTMKTNRPITKSEAAKENYGKTKKSIREIYLNKYNSPEEAAKYAEADEDLTKLYYKEYYEKEEEK